jgi:hypothetical protein
MNIPRKLLMVKREPPTSGFVVMLEVNDRTRSIQLPEESGAALMVKLQSAIIDHAVLHGLIEVHVPITSERKTRKRRT